MPCTESNLPRINNLAKSIGKSFKALYCLKDYDQYYFLPEKEEESRVEISFQACTSRPDCLSLNEILSTLKEHTFWFPFEQPRSNS